MAFNTAAGRVEYTASAGQTVFTFSFKIYEDTDIEVYLTPAGQVADDVNDILAITTDYTVTINGDLGGGVTLNVPATEGDAITLARNLPIVRDTDYQQNGDLLSAALNSDQNYQTYLTADAEAKKDRAISIPISSQGVSTELPAPEGNQYLQWNEDGTAIVNGSVGESETNAAESAANAATSEANALVSEQNAFQSAESNDPTNLLHVEGYGGVDPEGYTIGDVRVINAVGHIISSASLQTPSGYLKTNGASNLSRTVYADLFNATCLNQSGDTTLGSAIITNLADTSQMQVGMSVSVGTLNNAVIASVDSTTQITLSLTALETQAGNTLSVMPFGCGDTVDTFKVIDSRSNFFRGFAENFGTDASRIFGAWQNFQVEAHQHPTRLVNSASDGTGYGRGTASGAYGHTRESDPYGGNETRPQNNTVMYYIKY